MPLRSRYFFVLLLSIIFSLSAFSATRTWTGNGADNTTMTPTNWVENTQPTNGIDLVFPAVASQYLVNQNVYMLPFQDPRSSFRSMTIQGGNYTFISQFMSYNLDGVTVNGGNHTLSPATIYGTIFVADGASLSITNLHQRRSSFTIDGGGNLSILPASGGSAGNYIKNGSGTTDFTWLDGINQITVNSGRFIGQGPFNEATNSLKTFQINGGIVEGLFWANSIIFDGLNAEYKTSALGLNGLNYKIINGAKYSPHSCNVNRPGHYTLDLTGAIFNPQFTNCENSINNIFYNPSNYDQGPVTGFFTNYPEGSTLNVGGKNYRMTYRGGTGNDVQLIRVNYPNDFDGDRKSDISVFRPSNNYWYLQQSTAGFTSMPFGTNGDVITPADYTGDSKTDIAVFRPSNGFWYVLKSEDNTFYAVPFGTLGDIPAPADYTGDGKADLTLYRPSNGTWYRLNSENNSFYSMPFGIAEDKPTIGDFDGDGKTDIAVFRPSNGFWYRLNSQNNSFFSVQFGQSGDKVVPADYTGDGQTDIAVYRGGNWYILKSEDLSFYVLSFGITTDTPSPADYDGDGKADFAVYRNGNWYLLQSANGFSTIPFGITNDIPIPSAFVY